VATLLNTVQTNSTESIVQNFHTQSPQQNSVRAMFEDGVSTFLLSRDATLEELAGHLGHLAKRRQGRPIAFDVTLGSLCH